MQRVVELLSFAKASAAETVGRRSDNPVSKGLKRREKAYEVKRKRNLRLLVRGGFCSPILLASLS